jgi:hypothetical protein
MNAFSDTPMIVGGFDNGISNQVLWAINYQIYFGDKVETTVAWLKAFGCDAIVGDEPGSTEVYHPYNHPEKLKALRELWRDGHEAIYAISRARRSLAHVVRAADLLHEMPPPDDTKPMEPFLAALDDPSLPNADFEWRGSSAADISANLRPDLLLYVQIAWDQGWHALVNGETRKTWADPLGQMVVEPRCSGPCSVNLVWDGGMEMHLARVVSPAALIAGLLWIGWVERLRRRDSNVIKRADAV